MSDEQEYKCENCFQVFDGEDELTDGLCCDCSDELDDSPTQEFCDNCPDERAVKHLFGRDLCEDCVDQIYDSFND